MMIRSSRRGFLSLAVTPLFAQQDFHAHPAFTVERARPGKPRAGQVVAAIQPHVDDIPIFAAGTLFKFISEGAKAYLIRVTNDDSAGPGTVSETVAANDRDNREVTRIFGVERNFDLNYPNHNMDHTSRPELRARFIYLFRLLKVDTILTYDPSGHYEENPDHYVTSACVEAAAWMAGGDKDYPEHFHAGLTPHAPREKYYFARFQQRVNRIVDITPFVEQKVDVNLANLAQGPAGANGVKLRERLKQSGQRLPLLDGDDRTANRNYIREFVLARDRETGSRHGLAYAEAFHYRGPETDPVEEFIRQKAVKL